MAAAEHRGNVWHANKTILKERVEALKIQFASPLDSFLTSAAYDSGRAQFREKGSFFKAAEVNPERAEQITEGCVQVPAFFYTILRDCPGAVVPDKGEAEQLRKFREWANQEKEKIFSADLVHGAAKVPSPTKKTTRFNGKYYRVRMPTSTFEELRFDEVPKEIHNWVEIRTQPGEASTSKKKGKAACASPAPVVSPVSAKKSSVEEVEPKLLDFDGNVDVLGRLSDEELCKIADTGVGVNSIPPGLEAEHEDLKQSVEVKQSILALRLHLCNLRSALFAGRMSLSSTIVATLAFLSATEMIPEGTTLFVELLGCVLLIMKGNHCWMLLGEGRWQMIYPPSPPAPKLPPPIVRPASADDTKRTVVHESTPGFANLVAAQLPHLLASERFPNAVTPSAPPAEAMHEKLVELQRFVIEGEMLLKQPRADSFYTWLFQLAVLNRAHLNDCLTDSQSQAAYAGELFTRCDKLNATFASALGVKPVYPPLSALLSGLGGFHVGVVRAHGEVRVL